MTRALVRQPRARSGIALLSVLVAMTLLAAFAIGAAFLAVLEARGERAAGRAPVLQAAAESLAASALDAWPGAAARLDVGDSLAWTSGDGRRAARLRVLRLAPSRYLVTAGVEELPRGARGGVWLAVRRDSLGEPIAAAVIARGALDVRDRAVVDDRDVTVPGWTGCGSVVPNDTAADTVSVAATRDSSTSPATLGGVPWDTLAAHADVRNVAPVEPAPVVARGRCVAGEPDANWGEPRRAAPSACASYFPVVSVRGTVVLRGGARGQGVLLVDGDLEMRDDAYFAGVVLVRGRVRLDGAARIDGALRVLDENGAGSVIGGDARVQRSACVAGRALAAAAAPRPDGVHAWGPLY